MKKEVITISFNDSVDRALELLDKSDIEVTMSKDSYYVVLSPEYDYVVCLVKANSELQAKLLADVVCEKNTEPCIFIKTKLAQLQYKQKW